MIFINFAPCCLCYLSFFFSLLILKIYQVISFTILKRNRYHFFEAICTCRDSNERNIIET